MSVNIFKTIALLAPILLGACANVWSMTGHTDDYSEVFFGHGAGGLSSMKYDGVWEPSKIRCSGHAEVVDIAARWSHTMECEDGRTLTHDIFRTGHWMARGTGKFSDGTGVTILGGLTGTGYAEKEHPNFQQEQARRLALRKTTTAAQEKQADSKPVIYIAYPKGTLEIADSAVSVLGYVNMPNKSKELQVFLNKLSLNVKSLWADAPIETEGLRGYPLKLLIPLQPGQNKISINVLDDAGFLEQQSITVNRIEIEETAVKATNDLPSRLADITVAQRDGNVSVENFMEVLGDWVKDTAKTDYNKGNTMFDQGRFARAAYYFRKAIMTAPMEQAWFNLGISEKALGNEMEADEAFATACRMGISQACNVAS